MPLVVAAAGLVAGVWYASRWDPPLWVCLASAALALGGALVARGERRLLLAGVWALALALGAARMDRELGSPLAAVAGRGEVALRAVVLEQRGRGVYLLRAEAPARGVALLTTGRGSKLRYGDVLELRGAPVPPAEQEPYERGLASGAGADLVLRRPRSELAGTGGAGAVGEGVSRLRSGMGLLLERHISPEHGALAEGLLLGGSLGLEPETKAAFRVSGLSHILAASGYNVSIVAGLLLVALRPLLGARRALPLVLLAIGFYAALAGFSASVVRAALMAAVGVGALWLGRPADSVRALSTAVIVLTLWRPGAVFDLGAQLSFAATAGLMWLYPLLLRALRRLPRPLAEGIGVALAAQLATLPLGLYHFGGWGPWAVGANVAVAPLVPLAMLLSALTLLGGLWYALGDALGSLAGVVLGTITGAAERFAQLPGAAPATGRVGLAPMLLAYAAMVAAAWVARQRPSEFVVTGRRVEW